MREISKKILTGLMLFTCLFSCASSGASKGYSLRQEETKNFALSMGGDGTEYVYKGCNYVLIQRSGYKDTYFYEASYSFNSKLNAIEYFAWIEGSSYTEDSSYTAYNLAYSEVTSGSAKGRVGSL